jgi:2-polyprenyl-6-methoxyphenol hydroxylase-like FAD-dependent oxidoreductase
MRFHATGREQQGRAVVLGGSIAGLLAAKALADRCTDVVVVERDRLPTGPDHRRGVPQAHQIHALLAGGQQAVERLLPGITDDLAAEGAPVGDPLADMDVSFNGHRFRRGPSGLTMISASRRLLEHHIRRRVLELPAIELIDHCDVVGLTAHTGRVEGVRVLRRADDSVEEVIDADLVVDATGRGSRLPTWLAGLGYLPAAEETIDVDLGYATRCYRMSPDALGGAYGVIVAPLPQRPLGLALARLEHDTWMLTLIGMRGNRPTGPDGFHRFLTSVAGRHLMAQLDAAEPVDDPIAFRFPASTRRRYEKSELPTGLLVVGDSLCSFNPVYGQGISVAALEALTLNRPFSAGDHRESLRLRRDLGRIVDAPWRMTKAADGPFVPRACAPRIGERMLAAYVDRIQQVAEHDPSAGAAFLRVTGLVDHPRALLRPDLLRRALRPTRRPPAGLVPSL